MAELHVSKKNISKLFSEMQNKKFVIPDFQRPYKWNVEKCETLWNDIQNFLETDADLGSDYFLGTVVSYRNEKDVEIIDGQQRITSFFLLLRSFYKKLEGMAEDEDVVGLKNQIAPCIWDINEISQKVSDMSKIHIESRVATTEDNDVFHDILKTGDCSEKATDNYSQNYLFFKRRCDDYAKENPLYWKKLCVTILQKCIILPIECDTPETALTIFSTLNDRGLPLADSDIFKAQLYRNHETLEGKKEFIEQWKELTNICKISNMSIDDVFRYYTHVLRGRSGDKSKEIGLRKFYAIDKYAHLKEECFMKKIMSLASFWQYINVSIEPDDETYSISIENRKYLHCLSCYPNEFWKYATSVFFDVNKDNENFEDDFNNFLKKLVASLFVKFIDTPSVNAIKDDIYNTCININQNKGIQFKYEMNVELIKQKIGEHSSSRISRALLLLDAYLNTNQINLVPWTFDIEHIFPKKWQDTNYNGWNDKEAQFYLDRFGNKIVFEKKLNIQAGNGYFGVKKQKYSISSISIVKDLSKYHKNDWVKEDIEAREESFINRIVAFFEESLSM
jgi:uncharacterized protein with ParB-like and HNH nuclease domain